MTSDRKFEDLTGQRYGRLFVTGLFGKVNGARKWFCRCDCGKECVIYGKSMRSGATVSCGCFNKENAVRLGKTKAKNLTGMRFGRLVVLDRVETNNHLAMWMCKCDCGKDSVVSSGRLMSGNTKSCGCLRKEVAISTSLSKSKYGVYPGRRFGRLLVMKIVESDRRRFWECRCDCGKTILVNSTSLGNGNTKSCGCFRSDRQREIAKSPQWSEMHKGRHFNHSAEAKKKMRLKAIERLSVREFDGMPVIPCIGKEEKGCLDELNGFSPYPLQRQYMVEGYFLDGYIKELNLAIEFDEEKHGRPSVMMRDKNRQSEIESFLGCRFFRVTAMDWKTKENVIEEFRKLVESGVKRVAA